MDFECRTEFFLVVHATDADRIERAVQSMQTEVLECWQSICDDGRHCFALEFTHSRLKQKIYNFFKHTHGAASAELVDEHPVSRKGQKCIVFNREPEPKHDEDDVQPEPEKVPVTTPSCGAYTAALERAAAQAELEHTANVALLRETYLQLVHHTGAMYLPGGQAMAAALEYFLVNHGFAPRSCVTSSLPVLIEQRLPVTSWRDFFGTTNTLCAAGREEQQRVLLALRLDEEGRAVCDALARVLVEV